MKFDVLAGKQSFSINTRIKTAKITIILQTFLFLKHYSYLKFCLKLVGVIRHKETSQSQQLCDMINKYMSLCIRRKMFPLRERPSPIASKLESTKHDSAVGKHSFDNTKSAHITVRTPFSLHQQSNSTFLIGIKNLYVSKIIIPCCVCTKSQS